MIKASNHVYRCSSAFFSSSDPLLQTIESTSRRLTNIKDGHKKAKNRMKGRKTKSEFHFCSSCLCCRCRPRRWSPSRVNHNTCSLKPLRSIFASVSRALFGLLCSTVFLLTPLFSLLHSVIKSLYDRREVE